MDLLDILLEELVQNLGLNDAAPDLRAASGRRPRALLPVFLLGCNVGNVSALEVVVDAPSPRCPFLSFPHHVPNEVLRGELSLQGSSRAALPHGPPEASACPGVVYMVVPTNQSRRPSHSPQA
jgi:hypothetical protein